MHAFLSVFGPPRNLQPHYNIAPTDTVDVIRLDKDGKRELVPMRWGLIPGWWKKSPKEVPATFNARAESVADKADVPHRLQGAALHRAGERILRMDRRERREAAASLHRGRRLAPARLRRPLGPLERSRDRRMVLSCTIIVSGASAWMEPYHDRMPVMLEAKDFDGWLDGSLGPEALKCARKGLARMDGFAAAQSHRRRRRRSHHYRTLTAAAAS